MTNFTVAAMKMSPVVDSQNESTTGDTPAEQPVKKTRRKRVTVEDAPEFDNTPTPAETTD